MRLAVLAADVGPGARALLGETLEELRGAGWNPQLYWDSERPAAGSFPSLRGSDGFFGHTSRRRSLAAAGRRAEARLRAAGAARSVTGAGDRPHRRASRWLESRIVSSRPQVLHVVPAGLARRRRLVAAHICPTVVTVAGPELAEWPGEDAWAAIWAAADAVHLADPGLLEPALAAGLPESMPRAAVAAAPTALRVSRAGSRPDWPLRVLSAGPVSWSLGHEHAVAAVAELASRRIPVQYRLAGVGANTDSVLFAAASLGVTDRFRALGEISTNRLRAELESADVVLQPAIAPVASPIELAARAQRIPLVTTSARGSGSGEEVLAIPPGDVGAIADALAELAGRRAAGAEPVDARAEPEIPPALGPSALAVELDALYRRVLEPG